MTLDKHYLIEFKADGVDHTIDYIGPVEFKDNLLETLNTFYEAKVIEETEEEFEIFGFYYYDSFGNVIDVEWKDVE